MKSSVVNKKLLDLLLSLCYALPDETARQVEDKQEAYRQLEELKTAIGKRKSKKPT